MVGSSGVKDRVYNKYNQFNGAKNGSGRNGNNNRGRGGFQRGNGQGQNRNWANRSVSHWNMEKNKAFEDTTNLVNESLITNVSVKGKTGMNSSNNNMDNKEKLKDGIIVKKGGVKKSISNNRFDVLGSIVEDFLEKMEEDDVISGKGTLGSMNLNSELNSKDVNKMDGVVSQALEEVNANIPIIV